MRLLVALVTLLAVVGAAAPAAAQSGEIVGRTELRVCADPNNLPFSNEKQEGFENKIADVIGDELKLPVTYTFFPQIIGFVRNTLRARSCDLIMGTLVGDDIVQTTNPYYYSAYVAVFPKEKGFTFTGFDDPRLKTMRIGIVGEKLPLGFAALPEEPGAPRMDYRIAMGVRANEPEWRRRINAAILKRQPDITQILRDYGVPLLDERGQ